MFASPLRVAAVIAATLLCLAPFTTRALANAKVCRNLEQRYEQIEREADSIEINATLFSAADKGCEDLARRLLDKGASLEARDRLGAEPLARAAVAGERELVALFLDKGAPIDARNIEGSTALFQAAEQGRPPVVRLLIERGANISLPGRNGITPLSAAAYMGSAPIVQFLIEKGADPKASDKTEKTAIIYAA
ncbi:MAG TPA: hypothetical protein DIC31_08545, partial [Rhizobiales bacterium]|nr:hypothetical protein [Hyphomicrobiales bacterium]